MFFVNEVSRGHLPRYLNEFCSATATAKIPTPLGSMVTTVSSPASVIALNYRRGHKAAWAKAQVHQRKAAR